MNGIIICGGLDSGLFPLTYTTPKSMLPIGNIPISEYILKNLVECGINNIAMVIGTNCNEIIRHFKDGRSFNCKIKYFTQQKTLGISNALLCTRNFIDGNFIMILGDNYFDFSLKDYIDEFKASQLDVMLLTTEVENTWDYGMAVFDENRIVKVVEKPKIINSKSAISGIYFFTPSILKAASKIKISEKGQYEITSAIQYLINREYKIKASEITGMWMDVGRTKDLIACNKYVLSKNSSHTIIGDDTRIIDSNIQEYTSIGKRCLIKNSTISNSIIMDDCIIDGIEIYDSIVCSYSTLIGSGETLSGIFANKTSCYLNAIK